MRTPGFDMEPKDFKAALKKSSFAPGALLLNAGQRKDLEVFYAFCRAVDDSADEYTSAKGKRFLKDWLKALGKRPTTSSPLLVRELHRVSKDNAIPLGLFKELVQGALSDLRPKVRFKTAKDLAKYCHQVAGVVGQACLPLFGSDLKAGKAYAETLGRAFQLINIVRDAKEDAAKGRIYFALADLKRHKATEKDFLKGRVPKSLIVEYAQHAASELLRADRLAKSLPAKGLRPSRLMRRLYGALLEAMEADGLRVFEKRYHLSPWKKLWIVLTGLL